MGKNKKELPLWVQTGHSKPVSRRDFLSAGIIPFAASLVVPNWLSLILGSHAQAAGGAGCPVAESLIPFITLNLQGGAAMAANFVPMNVAREPIASYSNVGLGNNQVPIEREFGNVPFAGNVDGRLIGQMLAGVRAQANRVTLNKTAFVAIPCVSQNDTSTNRFDISGAVTKAGFLGSHLPNMGTVISSTGIRQSSAIASPPAPLIVSSYNSIVSSVGYGAALGSSLNQNQKNSLAKLVNDLSTSQSRKLASYNGAENINTLLDCAGIKNISLIKQGAATVDPRQNTGYSQIWGVSASTAVNNRELIFGSMVYNTLVGQAGSCSLEIGGYDYHNNTRTTGDAKDNEAGQVIGRILQSAAVLNKPVFIYVVSDGSVASSNSQDRGAVWAGDRGSNGVAYMLYFDPKGRPATSDFQIGQFNDNQAADSTFFTGGNPELAAAAVFANWCQANKRNDLFSKVAGSKLDTKQLGQVIKFG